MLCYVGVESRVMGWGGGGHIVSVECCGKDVRVDDECSASSNRRAQVTREMKRNVSVGSQKGKEEQRN